MIFMSQKYGNYFIMCMQHNIKLLEIYNLSIFNQFI